MAATTAEVPSTSDSLALEMETSDIVASPEAHLLESDSCWGRLSIYLAGFSNQLKGSVLCLVGILALTPDTLLLRRLQFVSNFAVQFYRNLIFGSTILIFITLVRKEKALKTFKDIGIFGWAAGLLWGASNMLFTAAIQNTAVANVLVIVASNTVFSSIFSYLLLGELIPIRMFVTSAICFGAIALIFSGSVGGGSGDSLGSILAVMASISQGLFFSLIRYKYAKGQDVSNMDILCYNVVAAIGVCIVSLALSPNLRDVGGLEILYLVLDGVFVLAGGFGLLVIGPGYIPANEVSLFFLVETILGPVLVFLGGYESPPKFTLYGGICLIFALAMNSILAIREENRGKFLKEKAEAEKRTADSGRIEECRGVGGP